MAKHVIIVGAGEVGRYLARILVEEENDVYVIENDAATARRVRSDLDAKVIHGSGVSSRMLHEAVVKKADLLLAVTQVDEVNIVAAMTAEKLNPKCETVARVRDRNYLDGKTRLSSKQYGIDMFVGPEGAVADEVVALLKYKGHGQISPLASGRLSMLEYPVLPHSIVPYSTNAELTAGFPEGAVIAAKLDPEGRLKFLGPEDRFQVGDHLFILCASNEIDLVLKSMTEDFVHTKRVLVVGGGSIGEQVVGKLTNLRYRVTVIEKDRNHGERLAANDDAPLVLEGDGTDPGELARRIQEDKIDAFVSLVDNDAESLLAAIVAADSGAKKVIARVDNQDYTPLAHRLKVDSVISPRRAIANEILRFVRHGQVDSTTMLGNHEGEILDFEITEASASDVLKKKIGEHDLPPDCRMLVLTGDNRFLFPEQDGDARIKAGDHVLVVARRDAVSRVEKIFTVDDKTSA